MKMPSVLKNILILFVLFLLAAPALAAPPSDVLTIESGRAKRSAITSYGAKNGATLTAAEKATGVLHQTTLTFTATPMALTDDGSTGHFATKIYDLPAGYIQILGASTNLSCTSAGTFGATGTAVFSLGTTATTDATLATTDANITASTSTGAFVASAGKMLGGPVAAPLQIDGHTTAGDIYLNVGDAADPGADSVLTCSGTITISWVSHGDN